MLSAWNHLNGTVKSIKPGNAMAEVVITISDNDVLSLLNRNSIEDLKLKAGDHVTAVIEVTEVIAGKELLV